MAPGNELILAGQSFDSLNEVEQFVKSKPKNERFELQMKASELFLEMRDREDTHVVQFYEWIKEDKAYVTNGVTEEDFKERFADMTITVENLKKTIAATRAENVTRAIKRCKGERGKMLQKYLDMWNNNTERGYGKHFFQRWGALLKAAPSVMDAIEAVNCEIWERVSNSKQGRTSDARVKAVDLETATTKLKRRDYKMVKLDLLPEEMEELGVGWGALGMIEPAKLPVLKLLDARPTYDDEPDIPPTKANAEVEDDFETSKTSTCTSLPDQTLCSRIGLPASPVQAQEDKDITLLEITPQIVDDKGTEGTEPVSSPPLEEGALYTPEEEENPLPTTPQITRGEQSVESHLTSLQLSEHEEEATELTQSRRKRKSVQADSIPRKRSKQCECSVKYKASIDTFITHDDKLQLTGLLKAMFSIGEAPCLLHCDKIADCWGMLKCKKVIQYFKVFDKIFKEMGPDMEFLAAVTSPQTWIYFDEKHIIIKLLRKFSMSGALRHRIRGESKVMLDIPELTEVENGAVHANTCLAWSVLEWINKTVDGICLAEIFKEEMLMYSYHFHRNAEGYLPVYHSLAQQLVRQDPMLHRLHVQQRRGPDIETLAIPTPLKILIKGDTGPFLHYAGCSSTIKAGETKALKDEILIAAKDNVGYQLQYFRPGSRFAETWVRQNNIKEEYIWLEQDNYEFSATIKHFQSRRRPEEVGWAEITMKVGDIALLEDGTPIDYNTEYGDEIEDDLMIVSTGFVPLIKGERVTLNRMDVPAIRTCHATSSILEVDLYAEILKGRVKPETKNIFPATVQLAGLGSISDALVGRCSWEMRGRQAYENFWTKNAKEGYIKWQKQARIAILTAWEEVIEKEKRAFKEDSFFRKREQELPEYAKSFQSRKSK